MDTSALTANLVRLRTAKKFSQGKVAEAAGLSRAAYRSIETGKSVPRMDSLVAIADVLQVKLETLLTAVRELRSVRFRASKKMTTRVEILAEVSRWLTDYIELEELLDEHSESDLPKIRKGTSPTIAAEKLRNHFGLDTRQAVPDICALFESDGIKVFTPSIASDVFFGLSVGPDDGGPAIVVNTWDRISVERWIFSAAHELGHLLLHLDKHTYDAKRTDEDKAQEKEADQFASHFLMPGKEFEIRWEQSRGLPFIDRVFKLKRVFRVSYKTVLYRVSEITGDKSVWPQFHARYKRRYSRTLPHHDEPEGLPSEDFWGPAPVTKGAHEPERSSSFYFVGERLYRLVREGVEDGKISMGRAASILGKSLPEMREIANSWVS
jgi:Zn-dependent peptidase ImmA (M78 family)/DNA-binding XRE family transcriptional regulator